MARGRPSAAATLPVASVGRAQVLRHRARVQELDRPAGSVGVTHLGVLDLGVQDTGPDGALWALVLRGADLPPGGVAGPDLALAWTIRGAPHLYRRADLVDVADAVRPFSQADAARRILDAAKPLKAAGVTAGEGLHAVASAMRRIVTEPMVKGEMSTLLTRAMPGPYLRWCGACRATHLYEMPFRLAALPAGLELVPGTSPPVLRPLRDWPRSPVDALADLPPTAGRAAPSRLDVLRGYLHLLGPARPGDVAAYLDAPLRDVTVRWEALEESGDLVPVDVEGRRCGVLAGDLPGLLATSDRPVGDDEGVVRLLGPFDLFLQARDRPLLVPDATHRKVLWPALGRPGAVLVDGAVVGTWRPRTSAGRLHLVTEPWVPWGERLEREVDVQAERLAWFRGAVYSGRTS